MQAQLGTFAGAAGYRVGDKPKVVLFWNMFLSGDLKSKHIHWPQAEAWGE